MSSGMYDCRHWRRMRRDCIDVGLLRIAQLPAPKASILQMPFTRWRLGICFRCLWRSFRAGRNVIAVLPRKWLRACNAIKFNHVVKLQYVLFVTFLLSLLFACLHLHGSWCCVLWFEFPLSSAYISAGQAIKIRICRFLLARWKWYVIPLGQKFKTIAMIIKSAD